MPAVPENVKGMLTGIVELAKGEIARLRAENDTIAHERDTLKKELAQLQAKAQHSSGLEDATADELRTLVYELQVELDGERRERQRDAERRLRAASEAVALKSDLVAVALADTDGVSGAALPTDVKKRLGCYVCAMHDDAQEDAAYANAKELEEMREMLESSQNEIDRLRQACMDNGATKADLEDIVHIELVDRPVFTNVTSLRSIARVAGAPPREPGLELRFDEGPAEELGTLRFVDRSSEADGAGGGADARGGLRFDVPEGGGEKPPIDRRATGFVSQGDLANRSAVRFGDDVKDDTSEAPVDAAKAKKRSKMVRQATGFVSRDAVREKAGVQFGATEEVQIESRSNDGSPKARKKKPTLGRQATGFVAKQPQQVLSFEDSGEEEENPAAKRKGRLMRQPTGFVPKSKFPDDEDENKGVRFGSDSDGESVIESPTSAKKRAFMRKPTGFVKPPSPEGVTFDADDEEAAKHDRARRQLIRQPTGFVKRVEPERVNFAAADDEDLDAHDARRRQLIRQPTGFVRRAPPAEEANVHFSGDDQEAKEREKARKKSQFKRQGTAFVPRKLSSEDEDDDEGKKHVGFGVTDQQDVITVSPTGQKVGTGRKVRDRVATPFVGGAMDGLGGSGQMPAPKAAESVSFGDTEDVVEVDAKKGGELRPVRERIATPFAGGANSAPIANGPAVKFGDDDVSPRPVEERSDDGDVHHQRPTRTRIATPFVGAGTGGAEDDGDAGGAASGAKAKKGGVGFGETEAIEVEEQGSAPKRNVRERHATPFAQEASHEARAAVEAEVAAPAPKKGALRIQFGDEDVEQQEVLSPSNGFRNPRQRKATPFVGKDHAAQALQRVSEENAEMEEAKEDRRKSFELSQSQMSVGGTTAAANGATGAASSDANGAADGATAAASSDATGAPKKHAGGVNFSADVELHEEELDTGAANGQMRNARDRKATPFISSEMRADSVASAAGAAQGSDAAAAAAADAAAELDRPVSAVSDATPKPKRSTGIHFAPDVIEDKPERRGPRTRIATPFIASASKENEQPGAPARAVGFNAVEEIEPDSAQAKLLGNKNPVRHARDRVATPFVSTASTGESGTTVTKQLRKNSNAMLDEHAAEQLAGLVAQQRQSQTERDGRKQVIARSMSGPAPSGYGVSGTLGHDESNDNQMVVARGSEPSEEQKAALFGALRTVDFFEEVPKPALELVRDSARLVEFDAGATVIEENDERGTHMFFVLAGEFAAFRADLGDAELSRYRSGSIFGEQVLLLASVRLSEVRCVKAGQLLAVDGAAVRAILREDYAARLGTIDAALDEIDFFAALTQAQREFVLDNAHIREFDAGVTVFGENGDVGAGVRAKCLYFLVTGSLEMSERGKPVRVLPEFFGESSIAGYGSSMTVKTTAACQFLELDENTLLEIYGEEQLELHLARNVIEDALQADEYMGMVLSTVKDRAAFMRKLMSYAWIVDAWPPPKNTRLLAVFRGRVSDASGDIVVAAGQACSKHCKLLKDRGDAVLSAATSIDERHSNFLRMRSYSSLSQAAAWTGEDLIELAHAHGLPSPPEDPEDIGEDVALQRAAALASVPAFVHMTNAQRRSFARALVSTTGAEGEVLFAKGDVGTDFFLIESGEITVRDGEKTLVTLGPWQFFGERALLYDEPRSADIVVTKEAHLLALNREAFYEHVGEDLRTFMKYRSALQDAAGHSLGDFATHKVIGRGGFGVVKCVVDLKTDTRFALKCVARARVKEMRQETAILNERRILAMVDHPFILRFVRSFIDKKYIYFLTELVGGGELLFALDELGLLTREQAGFYSMPLLLALEFLHDQRIAFRDLKSENVMLDAEGYAKLIDFGCARVIHTRTYSVVGTPQTMAPEVILGKGYGTACDLWSFGVCVYEFVIGRFPFGDAAQSHVEVMQEVLKAPLAFPSWYKDDAGREILSQYLLSRDPSLRTGQGAKRKSDHGTYASLKRHAYFRETNEAAIIARSLRAPFVPPPMDLDDLASPTAKRKVTRRQSTGEFATSSSVKDDSDDEWCRELLEEAG